MSDALLFPRRLRVASATHYALAVLMRARAAEADARGAGTVAAKLRGWASEHEAHGDESLRLEMAWTLEMRRRAS